MGGEATQVLVGKKTLFRAVPVYANGNVHRVASFSYTTAAVVWRFMLVMF